MDTHADMIASAEGIEALATELRKHKVIAFDTEFIRESTFYPVVEIIQVATSTDTWLVDAQFFKKKFKSGPQGGFDPAIQPLLDVFTDPAILKIAHAIQGDQECLYTSFGVVAKPSFDTAVGASLLGMGDAIGLGKLLQGVLNVIIKKGHARTNWSVRPLPPQLIEYAHADVVHLVELGETLLSELEKLGRKDWSLTLSSKWEDSKLYEIDVEGIAQKLGRGGRMDRKGFAALLEMVRWREMRVRQLNLPRRWVADDNVLVDLANVRPKTVEHLGSFRGLNKGELKNSGEAILQALEKSTHDVVEVSAPKGTRPDIPSPEEAQVLELLKCFVGILADQHKIAAKHLMTSSQFLPLLRAELKTPVDLVQAGVLSESAALLIGNELIEFMRGNRALSIINFKVQIKS